MIAGLQIGPPPSSDRLPDWAKRWEQVAPIFDRAIARGELDRRNRCEATFAALAGALYFRVQVMGQHVDDLGSTESSPRTTNNPPDPGASNDCRRAGAE